MSAEQLADLGEHLRDQGFRIATQQCVLAQQLVVRLAAAGRWPAPPRDIASHLGPIFCGSPDEQKRFPQVFDDWWRLHQNWPGATPLQGRRGTRIGGPLKPTDWFRQLRRAGRWGLAGFAGLGALFLGLGLWLNLQRRQLSGAVQLPDGRPATNAWISFRNDHFHPDAQGRFTLRYRWNDLPAKLQVSQETSEEYSETLTSDTRGPLTIQLVAKGASPVVPPTPTTNVVTFLPGQRQPTLSSVNRVRVLQAPLAGVQWVGISMLSALPLMALLGWWGLSRAWRRWRGQPRLERVFGPTPANLQHVRLPGGARNLLPGLGVRELGRELRRRRLVHSRELDTPGTIAATLRNGGVFTPVFGSRVEPDYLVLIDRVSLQDHQACLSDLVVDTLLLGNVSVERYAYDGSPSVCRRVDARTGTVTLQTASLGELSGRFPQHRLLLFSDGRSFFDAFTGEPAPWLKELDAWTEKAVLTPEIPDRWSRREWAISRLGFVLLPLSRAGLGALAELLRGRRALPLPPADATETAPPNFARDPARWLDRDAPEPDTVDRLCADLRAHLGETGFQWLAACAVYPEVHWGITVRLGAVIATDPREFEYLLPRLARLVWLRAAYLPDWFRLALLRRLPDETAAEVRRALLELLEQASLTHDGPLSLRMATDKPAAPPGWRERCARGLDRLLGNTPEARLRDPIVKAPPDSPWRDHVFLHFAAGARGNQLSVAAPTALARLLYPQGVKAGGLRRSVSLAIGLLLAAGLFASAFLGMERPGLRRVALSPDERRLAAGDPFGRVHVFDLKLGQRVRTLRGHQDAVKCVAFDPAGRYLASGSDDGTIRLWDTLSHEPFGEAMRGKELPSPEGGPGVLCLSFDRKGTNLIEGRYDGSVNLWEVSSRRLLGSIRGHSNHVNAVAFDPTGRLVASGSLDETVKLWTLASNLEGERLGEKAKVASPALKLHRTMAARRVEGELRDQIGPVQSVAFDPTGRWLAIGSQAQTITLWETASGRLLHTLAGHQKWVMSVAFDPAGRILASGDMDGTVKLWDPARGSLLRTLESPHSVDAVAFHPTGHLLASADNSVHLWSLAYSAGFHAIVIGCDYRNEKSDGKGGVAASLQSPVSDARALAKTLNERYGFSTTLLANPTYEQAWEVLTNTARTIGTNDSLVIFLAGHGYSPDNRTFAFPFDSRLRGKSLTQADLAPYLSGLPAREVLAIADADQAWRMIAAPTESATPYGSVGMGSASQEALGAGPARWVLAASSQGGSPPIDGTQGRRSPFMTALLESLNRTTNALSGQRLYELVARAMSIRQDTKAVAARSLQRPSYGTFREAGHRVGDYQWPPPLEASAALTPEQKRVLKEVLPEAMGVDEATKRAVQDALKKLDQSPKQTAPIEQRAPLPASKK